MSHMQASFCCKHTSIGTHVQRWQFLNDYIAIHIQCVQLERRRAPPVCLPLPLGLHISSCLWGCLVDILQAWPTIEGISALAFSPLAQSSFSLGCQCSELGSTRWSPGSHKGNASEEITDVMLGHSPYQGLEDTYFSGNTEGSTMKHFLPLHLVHFSRLLKSCRHFSLHSDRLDNLTAKIREGLHIWTYTLPPQKHHHKCR